MASQTIVYTNPGSNTFKLPSGISSIIVECIGGGGKGGKATGFGFFANSAFGGGGAGGSYSKRIITWDPDTIPPGTDFTAYVAPSQNSYSGNRGATGNASYFALGVVNLVYAQGGQGGENIENARSCRKYGLAGTGSTSECIGDIVYRGGNGGGSIYDIDNPDNRCAGIVVIEYQAPSKSGGFYTATYEVGNCDPQYSGPGGGGAGPTGQGGDAILCDSNLGGIGIYPGGNGGDGVDDGNPGNIGLPYGGGGAGGAIKGLAFGTRNGGAGNSGFVRITLNDAECISLYTRASCCPIAIGCEVFSDSYLTIPAKNGYYWDGTDCWIVLNGLVNSTGSCTPATTTTTTMFPGYYYIAIQQECPSCNTLGSLTVYSPTALTIGRFYSIGDGYSYNIVSSIPGPGYDVDLTGAGSGTTCFNVCVI
jgi:hypothetical protein